MLTVVTAIFILGRGTQAGHSSLGGGCGLPSFLRLCLTVPSLSPTDPAGSIPITRLAHTGPTATENTSA